MRVPAFLMLLLAGPAMAQPADPAVAPPVNPLVERLRGIAPASATPANCDAQVAQAATLNAPDLLYAAAICNLAGRQVESSFLMIAGQARAMADLALIVPATSADSLKQGVLGGFLFFFAGGAGSDEVLRDPGLRTRLWRLYDGWSPAYGPSYDPGWNARRRPDATAYGAAIAELRARRRAQLDEVARLYADETYYAIHRRLADLQARTGSRYVEGTPETALSLDLSRQLNDRAVALGVRAPAAAAELTTDMPPPFPVPGETAQPAPDEAVVRQCAGLAERMTIADGSRIARVAVTRSAHWGTIWRADLTGGRRGGTRITCTGRTSDVRPLGEGPDALVPLPGPNEIGREPVR